MPKKNNVNPNHYKEGGRTRPGHDILQEQNRLEFTQARARQKRKRPKGTDQFPQQGEQATDDQEREGRGDNRQLPSGERAES